jgi:hypothetical protein
MPIKPLKTKADRMAEARERAQSVMEEMVRLGPTLNPLLEKLKPGMDITEQCPKCGAKLSMKRPHERIYVKCETEGCLHFEQQPQSW